MRTSETPRISVIIPIYNAEAYLRQCLDSVLAQGLDSMEIICVDDGSTDGSPALLRKMAEQEPRLRVILQENRSAGAARNRGLEVASGEYVHFLDADDWLAPGLYVHGLSLMEKKQADVCLFQYHVYNDVTGESRRVRCLQDHEGKLLMFRDRPAFYVYNMVAPWNKLYRRSWLEDHSLRFDEIVCGNDRGFYYRMLAADGRMVLSSFFGVYYRTQNAGSLTGAGRYRHLDSLFFAWDSSTAAMENRPAAVRAMLLDCVVRDLLAVFRRTPEEKRGEVARQLQRRFAETDFDLLCALPFPCPWKDTAEQLCRGENECAERREPLALRLRIFLRIWGLRGLAVKLLHR